MLSSFKVSIMMKRLENCGFTFFLVQIDVKIQKIRPSNNRSVIAALAEHFVCTFRPHIVTHNIANGGNKLSSRKVLKPQFLLKFCGASLSKFCTAFESLPAHSTFWASLQLFASLTSACLSLLWTNQGFRCKGSASAQIYLNKIKYAITLTQARYFLFACWWWIVRKLCNGWHCQEPGLKLVQMGSV